MSGHAELQFRLGVEDGWPPVSVEGLPFRITASGYESTTPPLFVKGLSVGDVIAVELGENGLVESWHHISKSEHSVVWLLRMERTNQIEKVLEEVRAFGCRTVSLPAAGAHAIDVPESVLIEQVDRILGQLDPEKVAIVYPSFRHPEQEND